MARKKKKSGYDSKQKVFGILLFLIALLLLVSLVSHRSLDDLRITGEEDSRISPFETQYKNQSGMVGAYLSYFSLTFMGWLAYFIPLGLMLAAFRLFKSELSESLRLNSSIIFIISLLSTMVYNIHCLTARTIGLDNGAIGGYFSESLTSITIKVVGETGSYIVLSGIILILLLVYTSITPLIASKISLPGLSAFKKSGAAISSLFVSVFSFEKIKSLFSKENSTEDEEFEEKYPALAEKADKRKTKNAGKYLL